MVKSQGVHIVPAENLHIVVNLCFLGVDFRGPRAEIHQDDVLLYVMSHDEGAVIYMIEGGLTWCLNTIW